MTRNRIIAIVGAVILIGAIGAYVAYDQVLGGDAVAPLALPSGAAGAAPVTAETAAGTWAIGSGSQAGYRVRERLAQLSADSDAVGRTDQVTGPVTVAASGGATQVTAATITVDTTAITSDKGMRDNRLRTEGLQTDTYKTATFTLTSPVDVPADIYSGATVDVTLHGDLDLHGVSKTVDIPAQAQIQGGQIQIQGAITFPLSDYGIVAPNVGGVILSIADQGAREFLVVLDPA